MGLVKSKSKSNRYANNEDTAGEGEDKKVGGERPSTMIASKMIHLPKPHGEEACIGIARFVNYIFSFLSLYPSFLF